MGGRFHIEAAKCMFHPWEHLKSGSRGMEEPADVAGLIALVQSPGGCRTVGVVVPTDGGEIKGL
jgi:hypothetical protein